jgi:predicted nucleotidyltransferase
MNQETAPVLAVTPEKIQEAAPRLVVAARPLKIILFGLRARGDAREDSGLDLMVIEPEVTNRAGEMARLNRVLRGLILPVELVVVGGRRFEEWSDTPGTVYDEAKREGTIPPAPPPSRCKREGGSIVPIWGTLNQG